MERNRRTIRPDKVQGVARRFAFTLIELLVVVAIISLLLAILLPALHGTRRLVRDIRCQSNLGQLAKAWEMYLDAHEGAFYQLLNANLNYGGWRGDGSLSSLPRPLNPYVNLPADMATATGAQVFCCPSDNGGVPDTVLSSFDHFGTSYQTNILLIGPKQFFKFGPSYLYPLKVAINARMQNINVARVAEPARLCLMGDYGWVNRWMPGSNPITEWHEKAGQHNVAFLDGHVEFPFIRKGLLVTSWYRVLPFEDLDALAFNVQREEP